MKQRYNGKQTKEDILIAAGQLFSKKGYQQTSIQNIVDQLDGLSKGAIYHHFQSKEAILEELLRHFMPSEAILTSIRDTPSLNGLEKIRVLFLEGMFHIDVQKFLPYSSVLFNEPLLSLKFLKLSQNVFIPEISHFIEEGNNDGSLNVPHPNELSEIILFVLTTWYNTMLFSNSIHNFYQKLATSQYVLKKIGVDILNKETMEIIEEKITQGIEAQKNAKNLED